MSLLHLSCSDPQPQASKPSMEATSRDGSHRGWTRSSSYSISSSSGTVSTAYTCTTGSHLSSIPTEADLELQDMMYCQDKERKTKEMKSTVQEFFRARSASRSVKGGYMIRVMERWFKGLGVGWVLHLPLIANTGGASAGELEQTHHDARSWIRALAEIMEIIHFTMSLFPDDHTLGLQAITEGEKKASVRDQYQLARFVEEAMLKMLAFVDVVIAVVAPTTPTDANNNNKTPTGGGGGEEEDVRVSNIGNDGVVPLPYAKLRTLLGVRGALSKALTQIRLSFHSPPSAEVERTVGAIVSLLSAKQSKAGEAIWSTMARHISARARILVETMLEDGDDSSDIHKVTRSVINNIKFLLFNHSTVSAVVSEAASLGKYVPQNGNDDGRPLDSIILEMASCLEGSLANRSQSFQDQGLRFLFLLNNSYFIRQQNLLIDLDIFDMIQLSRKVEDYMESYLHVSWAPVLSCLFTPSTRCFGKKYYSPLPKFESEFQKTYSIQKLWKVPDPVLRKTMREAVTEKILPAYTKYIEDNTVTTPRLTPQNLQEMLQELFEG